MPAPIVMPGVDPDPSGSGNAGWEAPTWEQLYTGVVPTAPNTRPPALPDHGSDVPSYTSLLADAAAGGVTLNPSDLAGWDG